MTPTIERTIHFASPTFHEPFFYGYRYVLRHRDDGTTWHEQIPLTEQDVLFPLEGDVILQTDSHTRNWAYLLYSFRDRVKDQPRTLVRHDCGIDFQIAGLRALSPDISVLQDAGPDAAEDALIRIKDLGVRVAMVIEVTSPSTRNLDLDEKVSVFHRCGVPLYVIADTRYLESGPQVHLIAYRNTPDGPMRIELDQNRVWLPAVRLWLKANGPNLVCLDEQGRPIPDYSEMAEARAAADARAQSESLRAEAERQRAEAERQRAEAAMARVAELEAMMRPQSDQT